MNQDRETIRKQAENLVNARIAAGFFTASSAARAGGMVQTTYSNYERGKTPYTHRAEELAKLFNVSIRDLLGGNIKPVRVIKIKMSVIVAAEPGQRVDLNKLKFSIGSIETLD